MLCSGHCDSLERPSARRVALPTHPFGWRALTPSGLCPDAIFHATSYRRCNLRPPLLAKHGVGLLLLLLNALAVARPHVGHPVWSWLALKTSGSPPLLKQPRAQQPLAPPLTRPRKQHVWAELPAHMKGRYLELAQYPTPLAMSQPPQCSQRPSKPLPGAIAPKRKGGR